LRHLALRGRAANTRHAAPGGTALAMSLCEHAGSARRSLEKPNTLFPCATRDWLAVG